MLVLKEVALASVMLLRIFYSVNNRSPLIVMPDGSSLISPVAYVIRFHLPSTYDATYIT